MVDFNEHRKQLNSHRVGKLENLGCWCSVAHSCLTLCNPKDCSTLGFPVLHHLPEACSNSCPLTQQCHPTISASVIPFSSCLESFPASGSFPTSWLFSSSGQSIGASASASVLPKNIQDWFPLALVWSPCSPSSGQPSPWFWVRIQILKTHSLALVYTGLWSQRSQMLNSSSHEPDGLFVDFWESDHHALYEAKRAKMVCFDFYVIKLDIVRVMSLMTQRETPE